MSLKRSDQLKMLEACLKFTETGEWEGMFFTYPNCGWDLVQQGLATEDKKITMAGRAALWFLEKGPDPLPESKDHETFTIPLRKREP